MKVIYVAVLCLALASYVVANNIIMGERQPRDEVIQDRVINRAGSPWYPVVVTIGINAPGGVTKVNVTNINGSKASIIRVGGDIGSRRMALVATSITGSGMSLKVQAYGYGASKNTLEVQPIHSY